MDGFEYFAADTFTSGCYHNRTVQPNKGQPDIPRGKEVTRSRVPLFFCCWHEYFAVICLLISDPLLLLMLEHGGGDLTLTFVPLLINKRRSSSQPCVFVLLCNLVS